MKKKRMYIVYILSIIILNSMIGVAQYGYGGDGEGTPCHGVITGESLGNILRHQTLERNLIADIPVTYSYTYPELSIYQVVVTGKDDEECVSVRVENLNGTSKIAKIGAPGIVYTNDNVWIGSILVSETIVRFRVKNSWFDENGLETNGVNILKYSLTGDWKQLETNNIGKDDIYTYFETKVSGINILAISGTRGVTVPTPEREEEIFPTPIEIKPGDTEKVKTPGFGIIMTILVMTAIYISRKR